MAGTRSLDFREFRPGDEDGIVDLFLHASPHLRTTGYWRWANQEGPFGPSIVEVIQDGPRIVGHYAIKPMGFELAGQSLMGGFALHAVIHEDYRDFSNLMTLLDRTADRCGDAGLDFLYGFPNDNIWAVNKRMMNWREIDQLKPLQLPLNRMESRESTPSGRIEIKRIAAFDEGFDGLWRNSVEHDAALNAVARDRRFLTWRFSCHPLHHYPAYGAFRDGRPVGLAVLKIYWNGEKKTGHLVELVISKEKTDQVREALLAHVFATFRWQKVDLISLWMSPANPHLPCLTKMGFEGGDWHTNFGYLPLNPALSDGLSQTANWHLSMADSDAF
ncbi:MAG: GNAT family N-acetyltransferase [Rhodospirillales bacterium]|jgi:hypothetical protein|nr:GNAT family N-acetyltransferase [Rhodospirillales bacterium]